MNEEIFDVYITKYALTKGILKKQAKCLRSDDMIAIIDYKKSETLKFREEYYHGEGDQWHKTYEAALKKANDMKQKKITSLKKQLNRIEALNFDQPK